MVDKTENEPEPKAVKTRVVRALVDCLYHDAYIRAGDTITIGEKEPLPGEKLDDKGALVGSPLNFEVM